MTFAADGRTDAQNSFPSFSHLLSQSPSFNQGCTITLPIVRARFSSTPTLVAALLPPFFTLVDQGRANPPPHTFLCLLRITSEPGERGSSNAKHHIPGSDRLSQPAIPTLRVSKSPITGSLSESCELNNQHHCYYTLIPDRPSIPYTTFCQQQPSPNRTRRLWKPRCNKPTSNSV